MIGVVIPYYQRRDQLDRCLACLRQQTVPTEIFVRDNTCENLYFTAAVNQGLRQFLDRPFEYLTVLDQDMYLLPDALEKMMRFMDTHSACGIAAPLHLSSQDRCYVACAGGAEAFPVGKWLYGPLDEFSHDRQVPWADGACLMLRRTMIREIGLLDENFVFIGSDSDYCFTARSRGWQVWVVASAHGVHEGGAASGIAKTPLEIRKIKDMMYFARKWLTGDVYRQLACPQEQSDPAAITKTLHRMQEAIEQAIMTES
ncbi:MAG: glycosyltransferase family 2 protein [Sedimentisphaerales bacterium]|nr:glycosyltransferase family 2 protein [Sedimentisphaerales bacterium]